MIKAEVYLHTVSEKVMSAFKNANKHLTIHDTYWGKSGITVLISYNPVTDTLYVPCKSEISGRSIISVGTWRALLIAEKKRIEAQLAMIGEA